MVSGPFPEMFFMLFGMKKGGKIMKIPDEIRTGTKTVIFRGTCYFVGASTKTDGRGRRKDEKMRSKVEALPRTTIMPQMGKNAK